MAVLNTQRNTTPHDLLYVEDNPGDVALLSYFLKKMPVTVSLTVVEDGEPAIEVLHKPPLDRTSFCWISISVKNTDECTA